MMTGSLMSASAISAAIRAKKKKIAESSPEIIDTSPTPDMNAQDVYELEKKGYVEEMTHSPHKINAEETMMDEPGDEEMKKMYDARMGRLRMYFDKLDM